MRWKFGRKRLEIHKLKASFLVGKPTKEPEEKQEEMCDKGKEKAVS